MPFGAAAPKTAGGVSAAVYMFVVLRVYTSPLKVRRLLNMSKSRPTFVVAAVSHVRPFGSTAGALVWFGFVPFVMKPDCEMPNCCWNW